MQKKNVLENIQLNFVYKSSEKNVYKELFVVGIKLMDDNQFTVNLPLFSFFVVSMMSTVSLLLAHVNDSDV